MNRADRPEEADAGRPPDATDRSDDSTGLNGATFDPQPEPSSLALFDDADLDLAPAVAPIAAPSDDVAPPVGREPSARSSADDPAQHRVPVRVVGTPPAPERPKTSVEAALKSLPVAGINRRRVAYVLGAVVSIWIVAVFARQVGDASAAAVRTDVVRQQNAVLSAQVDALQHERDVAQQQSFIEFQARGFGLGTTREKGFTLAPNAPPLPSNAPGSASVRLAPPPTPQSPLDSWLSLLFGPDH